MSGTLSRLWDVFFVALLLFVAAVPVSALAGPVLALEFWFVGVAAHQPLVWGDRPSSRGARFVCWTAGMLAGGVTDVVLWNLVGPILAGVVGTLAAVGATWSCAGRWAESGEAESRLRPPRSTRAQSLPMREAKWLASCAVVVLVLATVAVVLDGPREKAPTAAEVAAGAAWLYAATAIVRLARWLSSQDGRRHVPDALVVVGVCLLAYGSLGSLADRDDDGYDRYVATAGAGLAAAGVALRRRVPATNS